MPALLCVLVISGCASVEHTKGLINLQLDKTEEGVKNLADASKKAPTDPTFRTDYLLHRDEYLKDLFVQADELRAKGKVDESASIFSKILQLDPGNARATSMLFALKQDRRMMRLLDDADAFLAQDKTGPALEKVTQFLNSNASNERALALREAILDKKAEDEAAASKARAIRAVLDAPVTLQFNDASIKTVFESITKSTGLNILLDRDVKQDAKATIYVKDVSVSDALDLLFLQNQLRKRVMNGNTMIIYPANSAKADEYEDLNIRTLQITNADIKYVSNVLKSMLKLKEVSADERTGILLLRDTPENIRMAEKLVSSLDVPDPEIMLEVEVLEVTKGRDSNLGFDPPTGVTFSTPNNGSSTSGTTAITNALTYGQLRNLSKDDLLISPLSATINFKLSDTDAKLLASPRIRARNKETAKIMIGDRVPTVTNSVTPVSTGTPVVTGNVTYQDVGLKLEFEPQVYANDEVGIKIGLEVSNIANVFTDANGGRSYQIGTRNALTNLRLKDGETQILGGLITDEDRNTANKIPGLGHLPFIGALFGNNAGSTSQSEIVLAITPHIIRNLANRRPDVQTIFTGTLNNPRERAILAEPVSALSLNGAMSGPGALNTIGTASTNPAGSTSQPTNTPTGQASSVLLNSQPAKPTANSGIGSSNATTQRPAATNAGNPQGVIPPAQSSSFTSNSGSWSINGGGNNASGTTNGSGGLPPPPPIYQRP